MPWQGIRRPTPLAGVFLLLFAGAFWGRKLEVTQRNSATSAELALSLELEEQLAAELTTIRNCLDAEACANPDELGLMNRLHERPIGDEDAWRGIVSNVWPELRPYFDMSFEWNAVVREATLPDGTIVDEVAISGLLNGTMPDQLSAELSRSRQVSAEQRDRGRLLSRGLGWGWKLCLAAMFVLPIGASVIESRRHQRMLQVQWREAKDRANPPPLIPVGQAASD